MKKYLSFFIGLICAFNAYGEGVVLSETSVDEESFVAPQTTNAYPSSQSERYVAQQIKPANKNLLLTDSSDPLFLIADNQFLSDTYVSHFEDRLRLGQYIGYGINDNFVIHADILYQWDWSGKDENGFSSTEIGGTYRMSNGFGESRIISDVLFGLKLGGSSHVRSPDYADSSYYAGLRFGRQYTGITLSGTVKSTWVFDDERGLSYLDFIPEAYFRFQYDWRAGIGFDLRKSTNPTWLPNQEWLNFKLLRQYGNTQYVGRLDYEFEDNEIQIGANVKILF
jgi:hypothetical protein